MSNQPTSNECTARGIACYQEGAVNDARFWLQSAIKLDKHNQTAWLWLSHCYPDHPANRVRCLNNSIALGSHSQDGQEASRLLAGLQAADEPTPSAEALPVAEEAPAPAEPATSAPSDSTPSPAVDESAPSDSTPSPAVDENAVRAAGLERLAAQARITEQMAFRVFQRISSKNKTKLPEIARQYLDGQLAQEQVAAEVALVKRAELANKAVDEIVSGTVVGLADFGAFVDIGIGSDALVHISELADQYVQTPGDIVQVGKTYTFKIISIDKERLHIGLSLRQAKANEAPEPTIDITIDNLPEPGDVREGIVRNIQHYGAFIDIGIGYNGLLHNTKLPQSTARDVVSIGDTITVRIEHIDPDNKRITLALPEGSTTEQAPVDASGWLTDHGVVVQESRQPADHDAIWDELALEMGDNYLHLEHLLRRMRQQTSRRDNNEFVFRLSDASPQQREAVKHFCNRLHSEYAFLRRYNFYKDTQTIKLAVNLEAMDTHTQFFNGYWFERYVVVSMKNLLESRRIRYDYLLNAHIKWNNGRQNELDVFFLIDAQPLWIECRSGQVADQIERYAAIRRQLGVPRERAVVLGLTVTDKATTTMTQIHDVTVANLTTFPQHVQAVLS